MRKMKLQVAFVIFMMAVLFAGCGTQASEPEEQPEKVTPVQVDKVTKGNLTIQNNIIGVVTPEKQMAVIPETAGKLLEVNVKKGDKVEAGQTLAKIDDSDLRLALEMEKVSVTIAKTQLDAALSRERQAEDQAKNALRNGVDSVQTEEAVRQARIAVEQANATLRQAELRLQQTENRLEDVVIKAPIAGEIISVEAEAGELVSGQAPLFTIISGGSQKIQADITAEQLRMFQVQDKITVKIPSLNTEVEGTVNYISEAAGQNGLFKLEVSVTDESSSLKSGMAAVLQVSEIAVQDAILIPTSAVVERGDDVHVFTVVEDKAVQKSIEIIEMQSDITAVKGELTEGDLLIVKGQLTLNDGDKVQQIEGGLH